MKYKKLFVWLFVIFGSLCLVLTLCFTLFKVKKVTFNFRNDTTIFQSEVKQREVIESANINYNIPIFAVNKNEIIKNLELNNPYIKVVNIETVFPNKLVLHCVEREELFYVESTSDEMYFICDSEFKVLNKIKDITTIQGNPCVLSGDFVKNQSVLAGEFLEIDESAEILYSLMNSFLANNRQASDVKAMFKQIAFYEDEYYITKQKAPNLKFTTYDNFDIELYNVEYLITNKVNIMIATIPTVSEYYKTHSLVIDINPNNNEVDAWFEAK